jgi:hypothetical protein
MVHIKRVLLSESSFIRNPLKFGDKTDFPRVNAAGRLRMATIGELPECRSEECLEFLKPTQRQNK